jgi:hypothetical protein
MKRSCPDLLHHKPGRRQNNPEIPLVKRIQPTDQLERRHDPRTTHQTLHYWEKLEVEVGRMEDKSLQDKLQPAMGTARRKGAKQSSGSGAVPKICQGLLRRRGEAFSSLKIRRPCHHTSTRYPKNHKLQNVQIDNRRNKVHENIPDGTASQRLYHKVKICVIQPFLLHQETGQKTATRLQL